MFQTGRYRDVEVALVAAYRVPKTAAGAFRAKLTDAQKAGLLGATNRPGKGAAISYGPDEFHRLVFACEMFEFGIAPAIVLRLVDARWGQLRQMFRDAEKPAGKTADPTPDDIVMYIGGAQMMIDAWSKAVPNVKWCPLHELSARMLGWMTRPLTDSTFPRALISNLSMRLRAFHAEFGKAFLEGELEAAAAARKPPPARKLKRKR